MPLSVGSIGLDLVLNKKGLFNDIRKSSKSAAKDLRSSFASAAGSVNKSLGTMGSKMNSLVSPAKKLAGALAGIFAIHKLVEFGKECIKLGSDLAEVQNVVDVTFGSMSNQVNAFAKNAMTAAGLSETMAKQYAGTFGAMAKAFGYTTQEAFGMSTQLTQLTGDVASFYNLSQDEAFTKLKSVFTGETESLKSLGVVMTQTALDTFALANGFGKTTSAMTEQEKVALRMQFVMQQLSAAQGDFARTSDSWANQTRVMMLQIKSIMADIGQGLINIFTPAIKVINMVLGKVASLASAFKGLTELLTGKKASEGSGLSTVADDLSSIETGMSTVGDAADNAASNTGKIKEAAEEAKKEIKSLMGFDVVNKLAKQDEEKEDSAADSPAAASPSKGSTSAPSTGLTNLLGSAADFGKLAEGDTQLDKLAETLDKVLEFVKPTTDAIKKLYDEGLKKLMDFNYQNLQNFWNDFLKPVGTWMIQDNAGLPRLFNITNDLLNEIDWGRLLESLDRFYKSLQNLVKFSWTDLMNFYESFLKPMTSWTLSEAFPRFLDITSDLLDEIDWKTLLGSLENFYKSLTNFKKFTYENILNFYESFLKPMAVWTLSEAYPRFLDITSDLLNDIDWKTLLDSLDGFYQAMVKPTQIVFSSILDFYEHLLKPLATWTMGEGLPQFFDISTKLVENIDWENLRTKMDELYKSIEPIGKFVFQGALDFYDKFLVPVATWTMNTAIPELVTAITNFNNNVNWPALNSSLSTFWEGLSKFTIGIGDGIIDFINRLKIPETLAGILNTLGGALEALGTAIGKIPEEVLSGVGAGLTVIATAIAGYIGYEKIGSTLKNIGGGIKNIAKAAVEHPLLACAVGVAALAAAVYEFASVKYEKDKYGPFRDDIKNLSTSLRTHAATIKRKLEDIDKTFESAGVGEAQHIKDLWAEYQTLDEKAEKSFDEQERMKDIASMMDELCPDIHGYISTETGLFKDQKNEIQEVIDKAEEYYKKQAAQELITEAYKAQAEAVLSLQESQAELNKIEDEYNGYLEEYNRLSAEQNDGFTDNHIALTELSDKMKQCHEAQKAINEELAPSIEGYQQATEKIGTLTEYIGGVNTATEKVDFRTMVTSSAQAIDEMNGIFVNGEQVIGMDAVKIYNAFKDELDKAPDYCYTTADGMMVQFGQGMEDQRFVPQNTLSSVITLTHDEMMSWLPEFESGGEQISQNVAEGVRNNSEEVGNAAGEAVGKVEEQTEATKTRMNAAGGETMTEYSKGIKDYKSEVSAAAAEAVEAAKEQVDTAKEDIGIAGQETSTEYGEGLKATKSDVEESAKEVAEAAEKPLKVVSVNVNVVGAETGTQYAEGVRAQKGEIEEAADEDAEAALNSLAGNGTAGEAAHQELRHYWGWVIPRETMTDQVDEGLGINGGSSSVMSERGEASVQGLEDGAEGEKPNLLNIFGNLPDNLKNKLGDLLGFFKPAGEDTIGGMKDGEKKTVGSLLDIFAKLPTVLKNEMSNLKSTFESVGQNIPHHMKTGVESVQANLLTTLSNLNASIVGTFAGLAGTMYQVGQTAAQSFANGWTSVHIPMPRFWVSSYWTTVGQSSVQVPQVNVQWLAKGGFVEKNTPQLAMIGDNRHQGEIVSPEDKLRDMAEEAARKASDGAGNTQVINLLERLISLVQDGSDIVLNVDGEELARAGQKGSMRLRHRFTTVGVSV